MTAAVDYQSKIVVIYSLMDARWELAQSRTSVQMSLLSGDGGASDRVFLNKSSSNVQPASRFSVSSNQAALDRPSGVM